MKKEELLEKIHDLAIGEELMVIYPASPEDGIEEDTIVLERVK